MSQQTVHLSGCKSTTFSSIRQSLFSSGAIFQQYNIFLSVALLNIKTMARIKTYYFSPTGGTLQVARHLAETLGRLLHAEVEYHSYTLPREREELPQFDADDIILWATPVYAGRIPNKTLDYVKSAIRANGNPSVALVTFGNRAYDNALAELVGLMEDGGMKPVGAAAMVTRHSFSDTLGAGRPNEEDLAALDRFVEQVAAKLSTINSKVLTVRVPGEAHPEKYYTPLKTNNAPAGFLKAKPSCNPDLCTRCAKCMEVCPMGSIGKDGELPTFDGICIKCQACRRICPTGAIAFTDPEYLSHVTMIEHTFATPKEPEFYVIDKQ
jgi:ferredoxin